MNTKLHLRLVAAAVAATMACAAHAQMGGGYPSTSPGGSGPGASSGPAASAAPSADMSKLDTNKDGYISKAEARKDKALSKVFDSLDTNKDGKLDPAEFAAYTGAGTARGSKP